MAKQHSMPLQDVPRDSKQRPRTRSASHARELELKYQRETLDHVCALCSLLRLNLPIDALFEQVTAIICEALHAPSAILYLANSAATFRFRAACGLSSSQADYLQHQTVRDTTIALLTSEAFHLGNFYLIPPSSSIWQKDIFSTYFTQQETDERNHEIQSPTTPVWERVPMAIIPLRRIDETLFGLFILSVHDKTNLSMLEHMKLLEPLMHQIEVVIEEARILEASRRSNEERAALIEIGRTLSSPEALREPETVYQTIYTQVKSVMPTDAFFVSRYYENSRSMWMEYLIDEEVVYPSFQYTDVPDWIGGILKRETPGLLFSTSQEYDTFTRTMYAIDDDIIGGSRPSQSLLFVPIHYGDEIIGMLSAQSYQQHAYSQHHMDVLKEIAVHAGIALVNARMNRELRDAMQQAQESERLKNHFLMTASHELRTPLTSIQGYLELLSDYDETLSKSKKKRFLFLARRAGDELELLLNNVMDTSRLDQDRVLLRLETVRVRLAVQLIVEIFEPIIVRQERDVQVLVSNDLNILADELRFRQVLLNVLGNALKYTHPGTPITIGAEKLSWNSIVERVPDYQRDTLRQAGEAIVISVQDWGEGISREDQRRLFVKFMRLDTAMNSIQRGAGLGLYLCRELVEAMHGSIWVESSGIAGAGTTFYVALPLSLDVVRIERPA